MLQVPTAMPRYGLNRISYVGGDGNDVTATKLNDPPYFLGTIAAQTTSEVRLLLVLPINVGDVNNGQVLTVTATSSNQAIGAGRHWLDRDRFNDPPAHHHAGHLSMHGVVTITLAVTDGIHTVTTSFVSRFERTYYLAEGATGAFFDTETPDGEC